MHESENGVLMFFMFLGCVGLARRFCSMWCLLGLRFPCWSPRLQWGEELWWPGSVCMWLAGGWTSVWVAQDQQEEQLRTTCHGVHVFPQRLVASCLLMSHGPKQMARPSFVRWEGPARGHEHREAGAPGGTDATAALCPFLSLHTPHMPSGSQAICTCCAPYLKWPFSSSSTELSLFL